MKQNRLEQSILQAQGIYSYLYAYKYAQNKYIMQAAEQRNVEEVVQRYIMCIKRPKVTEYFTVNIKDLYLTVRLCYNLELTGIIALKYLIFFKLFNHQS